MNAGTLMIILLLQDFGKEGGGLLLQIRTRAKARTADWIKKMRETGKIHSL